MCLKIENENKNNISSLVVEIQNELKKMNIEDKIETLNHIKKELSSISTPKFLI